MGYNVKGIYQPSMAEMNRYERDRKSKQQTNAARLALRMTKQMYSTGIIQGEKNGK